MADSTKQMIEITFKSPGACPPVYVSGAFTDPPWQVCEMKYHTTIRQRDEEGTSAELREYLFYKQFQVSQGHWQYKFRLGPGDWWVCDENAEVVADGAGNRNNLLVVIPTNIEHACVSKRIHVKPLACNQDSSQDSAWERTELDLTSHIDYQEPIKENTQMYCHIEGHLNPNCSREVYVEAKDSSVQPSQGSESISDQVYVPQQWPNPLHSMASCEISKTSKLMIPSLSLQEVDSYKFPENDVFGDRKMSTTDIEKVKLLMSIPSPGSPATFVRAIDEGDNNDLDNAYGVSRISPGPVEWTSSHAPLLPHECLTCENIGYVYHENHTQDVHTVPRHPDTSKSVSEQEAGTPANFNDLDDPSLELFPSGAQNILQRMATLHKELPPDETVTSDHESPFDSPARFTKDAPILAHEMPPIGSPADTKRKLSSFGSPEFVIHTDGPSDTHPWQDHRSTADSFRRPACHSFEEGSTGEENPIGSLGRSFAEIRELGSEEQPLIGAQKASQREFATYKTLSQPSSLGEGARQRSARTAKQILATENSFSGSDDKEHVTRTIWQKVLYWFSVIWAAAFGRQPSSYEVNSG
ncbi:hypothetical protein MMC26_005693 [Xylographa opegraphella]|nr:hypothetical protein [Xylographa opegraphella]